MGNKTNKCSSALLQIKVEYVIHGYMSTKEFNRETGMISAKKRMKAEEIDQLKITNEVNTNLPTIQYHTYLFLDSEQVFN
jgi:hypothetical protein